MKINRKAKIQLLFVLLILSILLIIGKYAGRFLVTGDLPQKSDVIVILAGDKGFRTERGIELYEAGYAPYIIVSGGPLYMNTTYADLMKNHIIEHGIPADVVIKESRSDSTYQNALYSKEIMKKKGFKSAIIVSSSYHMRRVKMVFDRAFKNTGIKLVYCYARDPLFNPDRWWSNNSSIMKVFNEYVKFIGYFFNRGV